MERRHRAFGPNDAAFKELFGVNKETVQQMLDVLTDAREKRRRTSSTLFLSAVSGWLPLTRKRLSYPFFCNTFKSGR